MAKPQALFDVRGESSQIEAVGRKLGFPRLPEIGKIEFNGEFRIVRIGPRRMLVMSDLETESELEDKLHRLTENSSIMCVLVSDVYQGIALSGADVLEVLAQITPLNLHAFATGRATATEVFSLRGIVIQAEFGQYTIYIERSYSHYFWNRLSNCA